MFEFSNMLNIVNENQVIITLKYLSKFKDHESTSFDILKQFLENN